MEWINPHSWIHIDVKNADGKVEKWMVEGGAPNALLRRGWNKNSLPAGHRDPRSRASRPRTAPTRANGRDITFPDGKKLFVGSSGTGAPDEDAPRQVALREARASRAVEPRGSSQSRTRSLSADEVWDLGFRHVPLPS